MSIVEQALKKLRGATPPTEPVRYDHVRPVGAVHEETEESRSVDHESLGGSPRRTIRLDREALLRAGFLPPESQQRQIANQFRQIKRPLISKAQGRNGGDGSRSRCVMVASSIPGEGKTFTAVNLAFSMSLERDVTVVLVDADVGKPHISRMFGLSDEPGLLDALQDDGLDPETLVLGTDVPGLSVLPAGRPVDHATELLASERMRRVMERLGAPQLSGRILLFDSPPLLLTNESRALAENMGQVVLVIGASRTPQQAVLDALDLLGDEVPVGLVLNQCETSEGSGYYYHGGGYGLYGARAEDVSD